MGSIISCMPLCQTCPCITPAGHGMLRHAYRGAWHVCLLLAQDMRCYQGQSHQNLRKGSSAAQLHGCCCGGDSPGCGATMVDMYAETFTYVCMPLLGSGKSSAASTTSLCIAALCRMQDSNLVEAGSAPPCVRLHCRILTQDRVVERTMQLYTVQQTLCNV